MNRLSTYCEECGRKLDDEHPDTMSVQKSHMHITLIGDRFRFESKAHSYCWGCSAKIDAEGP